MELENEAVDKMQGHPPASEQNFPLHFWKDEGPLSQLRTLPLCPICFLSNFHFLLLQRKCPASQWGQGSPENSRAPGCTPNPALLGPAWVGSMWEREGAGPCCLAGYDPRHGTWPQFPHLYSGSPRCGRAQESSGFCRFSGIGGRAVGGQAGSLASSAQSSL